MTISSRVPTSLIPALLVSTLLAYHAYSQDDSPLKVETRLVVVPFSSTNSENKPVTRLNRNEIKVLENGKEQESVSLETGSDPFAAVILIDTSGSMEERIYFARSAAITFLSGIRPIDSVAILHFHTSVELIKDFSGDRDIPDRVFDLSPKGYTALNDAIVTASEMLSKRPERRRAIIVLSDGADTRSNNSTEKALRAALSSDATIYTIDMNRSDEQLGSRERLQNQAVLKNFASRTGGIFVNAPGGTVMRDAFERIVGELKTQNLIVYESSDTRNDGKWRTIEVKMNRPGVTIRARKGYFAIR